MPQHIIEELKAAAPGIAGAMLALMFMRRPILILAGMFVGGCLLSWYGATWFAELAGLEKHVGLAGFVLGLFGMALVAKVYDTIEALQPAKLADAVVSWVRKMLGVKEG